MDASVKVQEEVYEKGMRSQEKYKWLILFG